MVEPLSAASQELVDLMPIAWQPVVAKRFRELEAELNQHRSASIALVTAYEAGLEDQHVAWEDIDLAVERARDALGTEAVAEIAANLASHED